MKKLIASGLIALSGLGVAAAPAGAVRTTGEPRQMHVTAGSTVSAGPCVMSAFPVTGGSAGVRAKVTITCRQNARVEPAVELWEEDPGWDDKVRGDWWGFRERGSFIPAGETQTFSVSGSCRSTELGNEEFYTRAQFTVRWTDGPWQPEETSLRAVSRIGDFNC